MVSIDLNRVLLTGRLGQKPSLKQSIKGRAYVKISLAVHSLPRLAGAPTDGADGAVRDQSTQWHTVYVWGAPAENCAQYLDKGSYVLVEGSLQVRSYVQNGERKVFTHVMAQRIQFLSGKPRDASAQEREWDDDAGGWASERGRDLRNVAEGEEGADVPAAFSAAS